MNYIKSFMSGTYFDKVQMIYWSAQNDRTRQKEIDYIRQDIKKCIETRAGIGKDNCKYVIDWRSPDSEFQLVKITDVDEICKEFIDQGFGVRLYKHNNNTLQFSWDVKYNQKEVLISDYDTAPKVNTQD